MEKFQQAFPSRPAIIIVVHAEDTEQTVRNVSIACERGADGVFLINHSIDEAALLRCYQSARVQRPDAWIGLSFMRRSALEALLLLPDEAAGLWTSDAGVCGDAKNPVDLTQRFDKIRQSSHWRGLYFGGVAFKYQGPVSDPAAAARLASPYVDVVTTSGDGTGKAASVEKIAAMKQAIGDRPLAIASGVTPENVTDYLAHADCFLVATGVSDSHAELNAGRVARLIEAAKR